LTTETAERDSAGTASLDEELRLFFTGDREAIQDPYPLFNRLREESPVHSYDEQTVLVSRHADVKAAYRDPQGFPTRRTLYQNFAGQYDLLSAEELAMLDDFAGFDRHTISRKNGADHARVRAAAHRYFTPKRTAELEPAFQRMLDELLDRYAVDGEFDFVPVAARLPLYVITELLGVPREDAELVKEWGDVWFVNENPMRPETVRRKSVVKEEYIAYTRTLIERNRSDPDKSEVVASVLDAADGDRLLEDELIAFFLHTLAAGHETTQHMIGNGIRALLLHREQWQLLCDDASLIPAAVEEILRWDGPTLMIGKQAGEDARAGGVPIPAGTSVMLMDSAANRDPRVFDDPDVFDITRRPSEHMALGHGVHFCLGASLARVEGKIVLETLTRRFPGLDFAADPATLRFRPGLRGLESLPVTTGG
jgi:cytochrome P450